MLSASCGPHLRTLLLLTACVCSHSSRKTDLGPRNISSRPLFSSPLILADTLLRLSLQSSPQPLQLPSQPPFLGAFGLFYSCEVVLVSELPLSTSDLHRLQVHSQEQGAGLSPSTPPTHTA